MYIHVSYDKTDTRGGWLGRDLTRKLHWHMPWYKCMCDKRDHVCMYMYMYIHVKVVWMLQWHWENMYVVTARNLLSVCMYLYNVFHIHVHTRTFFRQLHIYTCTCIWNFLYTCTCMYQPTTGKVKVHWKAGLQLLCMVAPSGVSHDACCMSHDAGVAGRHSTKGETGHGYSGGCRSGAIQDQLQSEIRQDQDEAIVSTDSGGQGTYADTVVPL